ncbi:MAG: hypothetical protein J3Q66DRAFT_406304 [Benniella sp.]|nr:MAG: hypothetical protein J3Q66DRAFT_406304 [Benniella sp.]
MPKGNLQIRAHYTTAHEMFRPVDETVWERVSQVSDIIGTPDTDRQFAEALGRSQLDLESLEWHVPCLETGMTARVIERCDNLRFLILNICNLSEPEWMQALPSLTKHQSISFQNECEDVQPLRNRGRVFQACPQIRHPTCRSEGSSDGLRYILDTCVGLERLHIQTLHGAGVIMKLFQDGPWACHQLQELVIRKIVCPERMRDSKTYGASIGSKQNLGKTPGVSRMTNPLYKFIRSYKVVPHTVGAPITIEGITVIAEVNAKRYYTKRSRSATLVPKDAGGRGPVSQPL